MMEYFLGALLLGIGIGRTTGLYCENPQGTLTSYNEGSQICCGGQLSARLDEDNQELACCQREGYPSTATKYRKDYDVCCNGKVYEGKFGTNLACCGDTQQYYKDVKICCGNQLYARQTLQDMDCCHSQLYNMSEHGCCWDKVKDKYEFTRVHGNDDRCCGTELYNRNNYDCKHGETLEPLPQCGGYPYNTQRFECCDGKEVLKREGIDVCKQQVVPEDLPATSSPGTPCGTGYINTNSMTQQEFCCDGVPRTHAIGPIKKLLYCCGTELIDDTQKCCGNQVLNHSQECCNNKIYSKKELNDNNQECCHGAIIDKDKDLCCRIVSSWSQAVNKTVYSDNECCRFKYKNGDDEYKIQTYNSIEQECSYEYGIVDRIIPTRRPRKIKRPKCPYCGKQKKKSIKDSCSRKKGYPLRVTNVTMDGNGMHVKARILRPRSLRKETVSLWLNTRCLCIKPGQKKMLYTNKALKRRLNHFKMNKRDQLLPISKKIRKAREDICGVRDNINNFYSKITGQNKSKSSRSNRVRSDKKLAT